MKVIYLLIFLAITGCTKKAVSDLSPEAIQGIPDRANLVLNDFKRGRG